MPDSGLDELSTILQLVLQCSSIHAGADPGFFLGGGALVPCSTSMAINHIVFFFFWQNTSCIGKPQVISGGGGGVHPLHPPPRSAPDMTVKSEMNNVGVPVLL